MKWILVNEMNFSDWNERNEFSIDFKHCQRVFIWAWPTDGQMDRTSYRGAMAHLGIIQVYFWIISSDFCFFTRFSTRAWPTDQPTDEIFNSSVTDRPTDRPTDEIFNSSVTDRPTDRPTDRASYRGAMAHLKTGRKKERKQPTKQPRKQAQKQAKKQASSKASKLKSKQAQRQESKRARKQKG